MKQTHLFLVPCYMIHLIVAFRLEFYLIWSCNCFLQFRNTTWTKKHKLNCVCCFSKAWKSKIRKSKTFQWPQSFELLAVVFSSCKPNSCFASILNALFTLFLISTWKWFNSCKLLDDYSLKLFTELMKFKNKTTWAENLEIEKEDVLCSLATKAGA